MALSAPERLKSTHDLSGFRCGLPSIDHYLQRKASLAQEQKQTAVYVSCFSGTDMVAAYYTLSSGYMVRLGDSLKGLQKSAPDTYPIVILGRMGISIEAQGRGHVSDLLQDAIWRCINASVALDSTALIVHPLTDRLADFCARKVGFQPCHDLSPYTMMLPLHR